jgi:hypothetical protein
VKNYFVKYYEGLFGEAQKQGKLTLLLHFYSLKTLNIEGIIKRKRSISLLKQTLSLSEPQVYQVVNKLKDLNWIKLTDTEIQLSSLDSVVRSLGLEPSTIKRWKVEMSKKERFKEFFGLLEISYSLFKQNKKIDKNLKLIQSDTEKMPSYSSLDYKQREQKLLIRYHHNNRFDQNWFSSLSTHFVASLLGYSSSMSAWNYLVTLREQSLIDYSPQKPIFIGRVFNQTEFKSLGLGPDFFLTRNNIIFKRMTNEITIF